MKKTRTFMAALALLLMMLVICNTAALAESDPAGAEVIPGLSPYFPTNKIQLPPGSKVIGFFEGEPDPYGVSGDYLETTVVEIPLTKTEAVEYFTSMMENGGGTFYLTGDSSYWIYEAVTDAYPNVACSYRMEVHYVHSRDVRSIVVTLYTEESGDALYVAYIDVTYAKAPGTPLPVFTELSMESLRQVFRDMNYEPREEGYLFAATDGVDLVDGFEIYFEQESGVLENIIFLELSGTAGIEKYVNYREGYAISMTYGPIYVEYTVDTDEVREFIEDAVKAAGGQ